MRRTYATAARLWECLWHAVATDVYVPVVATRDAVGRGDAWLLPLVLAATAATFALSVTFPFMHWDDPRYVWRNPLVAHPLALGWRELLTTPALGYPQPLTVLSYAAQRPILGTGPWSYHLVNLLLHLHNVAQVGALARKLSLSARAAAAAAMLFALHPIVVEPVCWVTGRKDLLATALLLLAARFMLRGDRDTAFPSLARWVLVSVLSVLAMAAKPSATVAAVVLGLLAYGARPSWPRRALALALTPLLVTGALVVASAGVDAHARTAGEAALDVIGAASLQMVHLVWPVDLVTSYARIPGDPSAGLMLVATLTLLAGGVVLARCNARSASFVGFAIALVAYAPMSNILAVNRWTADSYVYFPLVGLSVGAVATVSARLPRRWRHAATWMTPALGLTLAISALAQSTIWRTPDAVWRAEVQRYPGSPVGYTELARTLAVEGNAREAARAYVQLDQRFPDEALDPLERAMARWDAGDAGRARALLERGVADRRLDCAITYWSALLDGRIAVESTDPTRVGEAFDLVFDGMQKQVDDAAVWQRTRELLSRAHLMGRVERVTRHLSNRAVQDDRPLTAP